jgi:NodT family efflux transporter outer membrane factor (OMF) lipoprotein
MRLGWFFGAAAGVVFVLTGCAVGPDFVKPSAPVAESWLESEAPVVTPEGVDYGTWWTVFNDPVLDGLVEKAYEQNLRLQIAGLRILEARAQLGIAAGNLYPQQQVAGGEAVVQRLSKNAPNQSFADRSNFNYALGFDAAWELDFWGRFRRGVESADARLLANIANYDDVLVSLTAEVGRAYTQIRTFEERIEIQRENVKIQSRSLRIAEVRFENGAVTELDVAQARSLLRDTEALIPELETGLRQSKNALSILLGMPPSDLNVLLAGPKLIPTAPLEVGVGIPADLLRRRPDVRRAELDAAAQSARIGFAKADLFPQISLVGSFGWQTSSEGRAQSNNANFSDLFKSDSITYVVGPTFSWPILNYGRLTNNVRLQDARFQQLVVNYQNTVLRAAQEVEDGLVGFLKSRESARFLKESVDASKRAVRLAEIQYREGAVDYQRVLDTQRALTNSQQNETQTRGDVVLNLIATYKALGGGWETRIGKEFVDEAIQEEMRKRTNWGKLLPPDELPRELEPPPSPVTVDDWRRPDW